MLAKVIPNRPGKGAGRCAFAVRISYICGKAIRTQTANLAGDWQDAVAQMRMTQGLNERVRYPAAHIVLTWPETEHPSDSQMIFAARAAMIDFGAGKHQMVIAVHRDRANPHAHIVLNRVDPLTGKALSMRHDFARLELICRRIEHRFGWAADRGRFDVIVGDDGVQLTAKPAAHWQAKLRDREAGLRPDGRVSRAQEQRSGLPVLRDMMPQPVWSWLRTRLAEAVNWQQVHQSLRSCGLAYVLHRSGARIKRLKAAWSMPASQVDTRFGLRRMQMRLGRYVAEAVGSAVALHSRETAKSPSFAAEPQMLNNLTDLLGPIWVAQRGTAAVRRERKQARHDLAAKQQSETRTVRRILSGSRSAMAQALRAVMRNHHRAEQLGLREAHPAPLAPPVQPMVEITRRDPTEALRRRYRHVLRREAGREPTAPPSGLPFDSTACRQAWFTAGLRAEGGVIPPALRKALAPYGDDIRPDGRGRLLIPRRAADGAVLGFDILDMAASVERDAVEHIGSGRGLTLIGPRDADSCLITEDARAALAAAAQLQGRSVLIIGLGQSLGRAEGAHLLDMTRGKEVLIAARSSGEGQALTDQIGTLLPQATIVNGRPQSLTQRTPSKSGLETAFLRPRDPRPE